MRRLLIIVDPFDRSLSLRKIIVARRVVGGHLRVQECVAQEQLLTSVSGRFVTQFVPLGRYSVLERFGQSRFIR